ncbi:MAG: helix-turn-helix domain-containing protein [Clostridiales bacterium]|nr:helix-turn-helix domain-containing protein [Clostridiales bacterium]
MEERHAEKYLVLGLNIAFYRKRNGLTQEVLAELAGISRTHLSNIEAKKVDKSLSLDVLFRISDALGVSASELFEMR